jgi:SanA protein
MMIIRTIAKILFLSGSAIVMLFILSNLWVIISTKGRIYSSAESIPANNVAVVLGTSKRLTSGHDNPYFYNRMEATANLFKNKKVKHIIVSGDNRTIYYNEPQDMKNALVKLGVPDSCITLDYAGLRTLDSVVRGKKVFGQDKFIIVTQQFHSYRAIFISRYHGIDAIALAASDISVRKAFRVLGREFLARPLAIVDLYIKKTEPRYLGEQIELRF